MMHTGAIFPLRLLTAVINFSNSVQYTAERISPTTSFSFIAYVLALFPVSDRFFDVLLRINLIRPQCALFFQDVDRFILNVRSAYLAVNKRTD